MARGKKGPVASAAGDDDGTDMGQPSVLVDGESLVLGGGRGVGSPGGGLGGPSTGSDEHAGLAATSPLRRVPPMSREELERVLATRTVDLKRKSHVYARGRARGDVHFPYGPPIERVYFACGAPI